MKTSVESKNSEDILLELKELYKIYIMGKQIRRKTNVLPYFDHQPGLYVHQNQRI